MHQCIIDRFRLDGKKVLVTGGGQGLGRAFVQALAEAGADVAIADLRADTAKNAAQEVQALGRQALAIQADISRVDDVKHMVDTVMAAWNRLDIAVNNVGIALPIKPALEVTEAEWDKVIDTNLRGTFFCAQAEARAMLPRGYGKIINLASICGRIVWPDPQSVYSISKAGVSHLTRCLAAEWIKHGIRVNCISPGVTRTPNLFPEVIPVFLKTAPIDHVAEVKDLQGAVLYLASETSDFMVGHELVLDGGYTALSGNLDGIKEIWQSRPQDIEQRVRQLVRDVAIKGGVIVNTGEGIPEQTPADNVRAMIQGIRNAWPVA